MKCAASRSPEFSIKKATVFFVSVFIVFTLMNCGGDNEDDDVKNNSPAIQILSPTGESIVDGKGKTVKVKLSASASDTDGTVSKVEFLIDGTVVGEDVSAPYEFDWTPNESNHYLFSVRAVDNLGGVSVSGVAPFTAVGYSCTDAPACSFEAKSIDNVVMAFYPSWKIAQTPINSIQWEKLTHIIYSFALPEEDGELNVADINGQIDNVVVAAHAKGVKVYFSVGGGGGSDPFTTLSKNKRYRALFVDRVKCYVNAHCLDGVDIDWEHWTGGDQVIAAESNGLVDLLKDLRAGLGEDIEISTDVFASNWNGKHYLDGIVNEVTYVNAMLYDLRGPWSEEGPHSAYDEVIDDGTNSYSINSWGLMYWKYRGWPEEKIIVGMPFYGHDFAVNSGESVDYRDIVTRVQNAAGNIDADKFEKVYYDGPATAAKKAAFARDHDYAGVMFWELSGDTNDNKTSLLEAISQELND